MSAANTNTSETQAKPMTIEEGMADATTLIRAKILHALEVFPFISSSMINTAIGTSTLTSLWRPVLMALEAEGLVTKSEITCATPVGRNQCYTVYHLAANAYNYGPPKTASN